MAHVGQRIVYRVATSDYRSARITKIVSGTAVHLVAFANGTEWPAGGGVEGAVMYDGAGGNGISQGTAVGTWQEDTTVDPAISSEIDADVSAEATARDAAIATAVSDLEEAIETGDAGRCAAPGAGSSISLALNTARQPSATRPVLVTVSGSWSWSLSALGSQSGTATLKSDSASTPTTPKGVATCARGISVGVTVGDTGTMPWSITYPVPAGHHYQIATSGSGTFAIDHINETTL